MMCRMYYSVTTEATEALDNNSNGAFFFIQFFSLLCSEKGKAAEKWKEKWIRKKGKAHARAIQNQNLHVFHLQINFNLIYVRACVLLVYYCLNRTIAIKNNYAMLHADRNIGHILTLTRTLTVNCAHSFNHSLIHSTTHTLVLRAQLLSTQKV